MTSATTQKINPNNCDHEQLFKASHFHKAEYLPLLSLSITLVCVQSLRTSKGRDRYYRDGSTVMKDNNCASRKEGIKGNDQTDNRTSLCNPEDLFLALAHIENELARAWLQKFNGENKFPFDPIATLSEHHVSDNDNEYATLDCFIFMGSFGARNLATKGTQIPYCHTMQDNRDGRTFLRRAAFAEQKRINSISEPGCSNFRRI
jgi:hypothetical protein